MEHYLIEMSDISADISDLEEEIIFRKKKDDENDDELIKRKKESDKRSESLDEKDEKRKKSMIKIGKILSKIYTLWKDLSKDLDDEDKDVLRELTKNIQLPEGLI